MDLDNFLKIWKDNNSIFITEPPEISLSYTTMPIDSDGVAYSIPIQISNPQINEKGIWQFNLHESKPLIEGHCYKGVALFIDWLPTAECPTPVKLLFSKDYS